MIRHLHYLFSASNASEKLKRQFFAPMIAAPQHEQIIASVDIAQTCTTTTGAGFESYSSCKCARAVKNMSRSDTYVAAATVSISLPLPQKLSSSLG